jgi:aminopeptidase
MPSIKLIKEYAKTAVVVGAGIKKGQILVIKASTDTEDFTKYVVEEAYKAGASDVVVFWSNKDISQLDIKYQKLPVLTDIPQWEVDAQLYYANKGAAFLSIATPKPSDKDNTDLTKLSEYSKAYRTALSEYFTKMSGNYIQWSIVAYPNKIWAKHMFPDLSNTESLKKLWDSVLTASRIEIGKSIQNWREHSARIDKQNQVLNKYHFKTLVFKNSKGTNLSIDLVEDHIWEGGSEKTPEGNEFNPNIPTEESFSMPHRLGVNGTVYATLPLDHQNVLIKDMKFVFKDGKIVDYDSSTAKEYLGKLIDTDEGARHLGEVALISYDSPISKMGYLFYTTLYDENASCHLALGNSYPMNIINGNGLTKEERLEKGSNVSLIHIDFMFGSSDMQVTGIGYDGKETIVMKEGNLVI